MTTATPDFERSQVAAGSAGLIVCERSGRWAPALRRELADSGVRILETGDLADAWNALAATPAAFLAVELTERNARTLLRRMVWLSRECPHARVAIVTDRRWAIYEPLMREAGAVYFTCSPRRLGPLAELVLRHLADVPMPQQSLVERIWAGLPWGGGS